MSNIESFPGELFPENEFYLYPSPLLRGDPVPFPRDVYLNTSHMDLTSWPPVVRRGPFIAVQIEEMKPAFVRDHSLYYEDHFQRESRIIHKGPVTRTRDLQIAHTLAASAVGLSNWPPSTDGKSELNVESMVWNFEKRDEPVDIKNARIISMLALACNLEISWTNCYASDRVRHWTLGPHIGMLNAIGSALVGDLVLSEEALRLAASWHLNYNNPSYNPERDTPYASPGANATVHSAMSTMRQYAVMDRDREDKGVEGYTSYILAQLNDDLHDIPPGISALSVYAENEEYRPMLDMYHYILGEVYKTQNEFLDRKDELAVFLEKEYQRIAEFRADQERRAMLAPVEEDELGPEWEQIVRDHDELVRWKNTPRVSVDFSKEHAWRFSEHISDPPVAPVIAS